MMCTARSRATSEMATPRQPRRPADENPESALLVGDLLSDEGRDVLDLLLRQLSLEGRHSTAAVVDLLDDIGDVLGVRDRGQVGAAVAARAERAVAARAVVGEDRLARSGVATRFLAAFARVTRAGSRARCRSGAERAVEREEPQVVTVRCGGQRVSGGQECDIFLAVLLEDRHRVVRAGARLEAPELVSVRGVERLELTRVAPDEHDVAGSHDGAAVARVGPRLLPADAAARRVDGGQGSRRLVVADSRDGSDPCIALALDKLGLRRLDTDRLQGRADVEHVRL